MEHRYRALRFIASVLKILGYIALGLTVLGALGSCALSLLGGGIMDQITGSNGSGMLGGVFGGLLIGVGVLLYGGIMSLMLIAGGEQIYLQIAIEENTRATADLLRAQGLPKA